MSEHDKLWLDAAARAVGSAAPLWFAAGLLVMLGMTVLLWTLLPLALRRLPRGPGRRPGLFLIVYLASGFGIVAVAASVFAEMAEAMDADESMGRFDETLAATLRQSLPPGAMRVFAAVTRLGDVATIVMLGVAVAALLLWQRRRWLALGWSLALAGNGVLNPLLKRVFERVRPLHDQGLVTAGSWSFPSGHASGAVVAYGMLAYLLVRYLPPRQRHWQLPVVLAAAALAYTVGCSRIALQVHYASDVIGGLASGMAWLTVCVFSIEALRWYRVVDRGVDREGGVGRSDAASGPAPPG